MNTRAPAKARARDVSGPAKPSRGSDAPAPQPSRGSDAPAPAPPPSRRSDARAPAPPPPLHELEAEVMEEVWRQGETTVKLVMESLNRKAKPPRAYTTYMTVMRRLDDKGLLARTRSGRHDTYVPRLTREQYQQRRAGAEVSDLIDEFGDVALAHFARSLSTLDPARRRQLQRLASSD